jgi:phosphate transport system permease protein
MTATVTRGLVRQGHSRPERVAAATAIVAGLCCVLAVGALFGVVAATTTVAGIRLVTLWGGAVTLAGVVLLALGVASAQGYASTSPHPHTSVVATGGFAATWAAVGGLIGAQTLGLDTAGLLAAATVGGGASLVATSLPREDLGLTVPAGAFAVLAGVTLLAGLIGPTWAWRPTGLDATLAGSMAVPLLVGYAAMLVGWVATNAYGGFGIRGRNLGAHVLLSANILSLTAILVGLVAYVVVRGLPGVLAGVGVGDGPEMTMRLLGSRHTVGLPISWPFLTNGTGLRIAVDGVLPAIVGTVWLVVGALCCAVPTGVGAAVFLAEYADEGWFTRVVDVTTNGLWSTPSILYGLFGFAFLVPRFGNQKSLLAGMLTLGFMLLPLVLITSREALLAVPDEYRDASAALGVSQWQTIRSVVLPAAMPGVLTGVILGVGRIAGETAPILLTMAGGTFVPGSQTVDVIGGFAFSGTPPFVTNPELLRATTALPYQLYAVIGAGIGGTQLDDPEGFAWGTALVLLVVVLSLYAVGVGTRYYFRRKLGR